MSKVERVRVAFKELQKLEEYKEVLALRKGIEKLEEKIDDDEETIEAMWQELDEKGRDLRIDFQNLIDKELGADTIWVFWSNEGFQFVHAPTFGGDHGVNCANIENGSGEGDFSVSLDGDWYDDDMLEEKIQLRVERMEAMQEIEKAERA